MYLRSEKGLLEKKGDKKVLEKQIDQNKIHKTKLNITSRPFSPYNMVYEVFLNFSQKCIKIINNLFEKYRGTGTGQDFVVLRYILTTILSWEP